MIVGLGPGLLGLLTLESWDLLAAADLVLLRTAKHPTVDGLKERGVSFVSYDDVYDAQPTFDAVYDFIARDCLAKVEQGQKVVYAVPGSPLVAEKTVSLIRLLAAERNIAVKIAPGMSFLEVLYVRLGVDPAAGMTILDSVDLAALRDKPSTGLVVTQIYSRQVASEAKLSLMEWYADDDEIIVARNLGLPGEEVRKIPLYELDRLPVIDHLTSVYVPPGQSGPGQFELSPVIDIMARLRAPGGCLWDIEQTHRSLRRYLVEEVYEVLEAIDLKSAGQLCEELGDLLLQIVFHARIAEECGDFTMQEVIDGVAAKLVRRHPHVFGDVTVQDAGEVVLNWEQIKQQEKGHERPSVLDGIPPELPGLMKACKLQTKAAKVGFDWDNIAPVWEKIEEEIAELKTAIESGDTEAGEGELGDILFAVVNLARFLKVDAEIALNVTNSKFKRRFVHMEAAVGERGLNWEQLTLAELDQLWDEAKLAEG